jgi:hypothetical protein
MKVLFHLFKEKLNAPALIIKAGNLLGRDFKGIGQKFRIRSFFIKNNSR